MRQWNASLFSEASGAAQFRLHSSTTSGHGRGDLGLRHCRCTGQFGTGGTIPFRPAYPVAGLHTARQNPATEHAESEGAAEQPDAADEAQGGTRTAS